MAETIEILLEDVVVLIFIFYIYIFYEELSTESAQVFYLWKVFFRG